MDCQTSSSLLILVARGQLLEAHLLLQNSSACQRLLCHAGPFTDYSGRKFNCTAYEYAFWAKDGQMCQMLEAHMDEKTKAYICQKIKVMLKQGLKYMQNGEIFINPHYDSCFILKNLSRHEFQYLKKLLINQPGYLKQSSLQNYRKVSFNAFEYQALVKTLKHIEFKPSGKYRPTLFHILFYPLFDKINSTQTTKLNKLIDKINAAFDFNSLVVALSEYIDQYDHMDYNHRDLAWLAVGKAQREVPVHIATEYCHPHRSFHPIPAFEDIDWSRNLSFKNYVGQEHLWFPLSAYGKGLGYDFALAREGRKAAWCWGVSGRPSRSPRAAAKDLHALKQLLNIRTQDIQQSLKHIMRFQSS